MFNIKIWNAMSLLNCDYTLKKNREIKTVLESKCEFTEDIQMKKEKTTIIIISEILLINGWWIVCNMFIEY